MPASERHDLLGSYYVRLTNPDPAVHLPAARAGSMFEGACSTLLPSAETLGHFADDRVALGLARIEAHYFAHGGFLGPDELLARIDRVRSIPAVIVQGRYDMVCPLVSAAELHAAWPESEFVIVPDAGHSAWEPGIVGALVAANERFKRIL